jgi:hypothetical protein
VVGGVVFAVSRDFVIGVGAAAGIYAVGVRAVKAWAHPGADERDDRAAGTTSS